MSTGGRGRLPTGGPDSIKVIQWKGYSVSLGMDRSQLSCLDVEFVNLPSNGALEEESKSSPQAPGNQLGVNLQERDITEEIPESDGIRTIGEGESSKAEGATDAGKSDADRSKAGTSGGHLRWTSPM